MATRLNARLGLSVGTTPTNVIDANGSITANSITIANTFAIGANVNANTTGLYVGNSTVNSTHTATLLQVANSTSTANLTPLSLNIGATVVNATALSVSTTVYANGVVVGSGYDGQINFGGDNNGALELGRSGRAASGSPYIDFHSASASSDYDVRVQATGGNTTTGSGNLAIYANVVNLPNTVITGTANATVAFNIGANVQANTTALYVGNSTVNTIVTGATLRFGSSPTQGIAFYESFDNYFISMKSQGSSQAGRLDSTSDYNMYFQMNGGTNRGFVFRGNNAVDGAVSQIDASGNFYTRGNHYVGVGTSNAVLTPTSLSISNGTVTTVVNAIAISTNGTLTVSNTATLGNTTITGFINVSSTANIGGAITARSDVTVNGQLIVANTISTGNATHTGFLNVSTTANVGGVLNARSDVVVNGALIVANTAALGNTTITGWANVSSNLQAVNVRTTGDVQIDGNLIVSGNTITIGVTNLNVSDNMIYLNEPETATITSATSNGTAYIYTAAQGFTVGQVVTIAGMTPSGYNLVANTITFANSSAFATANTSAPGSYVSGGTATARVDSNPDIGFAANYNDGTYRHAGFFRDATDGVFKVFDQYVPEPNGAFIDTANNTFRIADFQANNTTLSGNTYLGGVSGSESVRIPIVSGANRPFIMQGGVSGVSGARIGANENIDYYTTGSFGHYFATNGPRTAIQFEVAHTSSSVNWLKVTGNSTTNAPNITAQGSDTDIGVVLSTKGAGRYSFFTNGLSNEQFRITHTASAVNYIQVTGANTTNYPSFQVAGTDTNIGLIIGSKGTGPVYLKTGSSAIAQFVVADVASSVNYLQVKGAATGAAVSLSALGSDTNIDLNHTSKGTGAHSFTTGGGTQVKITDTTSAVNYVSITGSITNSRANISVVGADANGAGLNIFTKGSGELVMGGNGREVLVVSPQTSAAANFLQVLNGPSGTGTTIKVSPFSTDTNVDFNHTTKGTGAHNFNTGGGLQLKVIDIASAVNYPRLSGAATGAGPALYFDGADSTVVGVYGVKGAGAHLFYTNNNPQFRIADTASAVNYIQVTGGATTANVSISAQGTDSNVSINYTTKGSGAHYFNSNTIHGANSLVVDTALSRVGIGHGLGGIPGALSVTSTYDGDGVRIRPGTSGWGVSLVFANSTSTVSQIAGINGVGNFSTVSNIGDVLVLPANNFQVANSTVSRFIVAANGNVGIGNSTPVDKFVSQTSSNTQVILSKLVNIDTGTGAVAIQRLTSGVDKSLTMFASGGGYSGMYGNANAPTHYNDFDSHVFRTIAGTVKAVFAANGNVGIGNSSPTETLRVEGTFSALTSASIGSNVVANTSAVFVGNASVNTVITSSQITTANLVLSTVASVGANLIANTSALFIGNSTVNAVMTANSLNISDASGSVAAISNSAVEFVVQDAGTGFKITRNSIGGTQGFRFTTTSGGHFITTAATAANPKPLTVNVVSGNATYDTAYYLSIDSVQKFKANTTQVSLLANTSITGDATISGNLTVSGTTTYINTTNLNVGDNIITLNADLGAVAPTENAGIEINRGTSANVFFLWNETNGSWQANGGAFTVANSTVNTFVVAANGNVGVGNSTPADKLSVFGTVAVTNSTANVINIAANGNIGIGYNSPNFKLRVGGTIVGDANDNYFGTMSGDYVDIGNLGATGSVYFDARGASANVSVNYRAKGTAGHYWTNQGGSTEVMRIAANNNVGVGTATPYDKFHVAHDSNTQGTATFFNANNDTTAKSIITLAANTTSMVLYQNAPNSTSGEWGMYSGSATMFKVSTNAVSRMVISANGNVGIGNNVPTDKLRVEGTLSHLGLTPSTGTGIDQIYTATPSLTLNTNWQSTGVTATNLANGTYIVQMLANDVAAGGTANNEYYSGIMSWYSADVNSTVIDEIPLHRAGVSGSNNSIFLATQRTATANTSDLILMISSAANNSSSSTYTLKFRRMI